MAESSREPVFLFDDADQQMQQAYADARDTFRYFWRELAWEYRRIIPAFGLACVKAPFSDGGEPDAGSDNPNVEQMWISEIEFDGDTVRGVLINSPNWLTSVQAGDQVEVPLSRITDWMLACPGRVCGGYTVNLMRSRMSKRERAEHDTAWGLDFGDPNTIQLVPDYNGPPRKGFFSKLLGNSFPTEPVTPPAEHPMSDNMASSLREQLSQSPEMANEPDQNGWTMLHSLALAGSTACVEVLLQHGANVNAVTNDGKTPLWLANSLDWSKTAAVLQAAGGR